MKDNDRTNLPIAIDAMGNDLGPAEIIAAVELAVREVPGLNDLLLVGDQAQLGPLLQQSFLRHDKRIRIEHAPSVIGMHEKPKDSFKKKDASMIRALDLVKQGEAGAVVSCGNTGALMFASTLMLRKLPMVERPALATVIPSRKHHFLLLDCGAQPDTTASQLVQNAVMGYHYCRVVLPPENPRVGLMTIGTEEGKGTDRILRAHEDLKRLHAAGILNYVGPIEGFDTFNNVADVIVCDGFTGNVLLKTLESCYDNLKIALKEELLANPLRKLGTLLTFGAYRSFKKTFSPDNYSGAPFLGLNETVLKAHGSSNRYFIRGAIRIASETLHHGLQSMIAADIERSVGLLRPAPGDAAAMPASPAPAGHGQLAE